MQLTLWMTRTSVLRGLKRQRQRQHQHLLLIRSLGSLAQRTTLSLSSSSLSWQRRRDRTNPSACVASMTVPLVAAMIAEHSAVQEDHATTACESLHAPDEEEEEQEHVHGSQAIGNTAYFDDDYETTSLLGCGTFGLVMQCTRRRDGRQAAVKMIEAVADTQDEVWRETHALQSIQRLGGHANIVRYDCAYQHDGYHFLVTELIRGESLFSLIQKNSQLELTVALQLTAQLASAVAFLHRQGLTHCDLKPENIMIESGATDRELRVKIIDFGSADCRKLVQTPKEPPRSLSLSGTRCYWPPEVLDRLETSPAMDMWALGCILYIMISGRHPFDTTGCTSEGEIVGRIQTMEPSLQAPVWAAIPTSFKTLILGLLDKDPSTRLSIEDVLACPSIRVHLT